MAHTFTGECNAVRRVNAVAVVRRSTRPVNATEARQGVKNGSGAGGKSIAYSEVKTHLFDWHKDKMGVNYEVSKHKRIHCVISVMKTKIKG